MFATKYDKFVTMEYLYSSPGFEYNLILASIFAHDSPNLIF